MFVWFYYEWGKIYIFKIPHSFTLTQILTKIKKIKIIKQKNAKNYKTLKGKYAKINF